MSLDVRLGHICPHCKKETDAGNVFASNITHNFGRMAYAAGIYDCVWRPDENSITTAAQLIEPLQAGIAKMKAQPEYYRQFDTPNGWGTCDQFLPWLQEYLDACIANPDSPVTVSR